ncbi:U11/U12 small nuclear ribonucleoprotein 48 kDa protein-like [Harmonia axyridis]|uniref:U11/U12 small nuclear ribonucleoprotein 48 kDa protein-like n=1 Tax=Harmonia axyridis TaxID=115357 RepID=UPI001E2766ED|nr:U11/U12 small nuclear ribonucleoprotein 48 kDa protein-like [Harmonia axyridis]
MAVDFNIEIRKKQLESLDHFVTCSREKVQSIMKCLGWSVDKIQEEQRLFVTCPYNDNHKVPAEKTDDHINKCKIKSAGYNLQEEFLSEPIKSEGGTIEIGKDKKIDILCQAVSQKPFFQTAWNGKDPDPQTYSRLISTFSCDERLVLYDHCVANTKGPLELPEFDTSIERDEKRDSEFTKEALKSFERDMKRRSVKYKPIHTNHKNYKEVLRELIDSQMQQYSDWLEHVNGSKGPHTPEDFYTQKSIEEDEAPEIQDNSQEHIDRPHSSISKISNNSSGSHSTKGNRHTRTSHSDFQLSNGSKNHYNKDSHSNYFCQSFKSKNKYMHHDEDSQESNSISKVSSIDMDSSCENNESTSRNHSRDSSIQRSYKHKDKGTRYEDRRHKSRSNNGDRRKRDHSSGSSRHSSRSHKSKEDRYHKHHSREKYRRHKSYYEDT